MKTYISDSLDFYLLRPIKLTINFLKPSYPSPRKIRQEAIRELEEERGHIDKFISEAEELIGGKFRIDALVDYDEPNYRKNTLLDAKTLKKRVNELIERRHKLQLDFDRYIQPGVVEALEGYNESHLKFVSLVEELREVGIFDGNRLCPKF